MNLYKYIRNLSFIIFLIFPLIGKTQVDLNRIKKTIQLASADLLSRKVNDTNWNFGSYQGIQNVSLYFIILNFLTKKNSKLNPAILKFKLLESQTEKGYWLATRDLMFSDIVHSPADFNATILNYFSLKLMDTPFNHPKMVKAREFIIKNGGLEAANEKVKTILAMTGNLPWKMVPKISSWLLSPVSPVKLSDFAAWVEVGLSSVSYMKNIEIARRLKNSSKTVLLPELWSNKIKRDTFFQKVPKVTRYGVSEAKKRWFWFGPKAKHWIDQIAKSSNNGKTGAIKGDTITTMFSMAAMDSFIQFEHQTLTEKKRFNHYIPKAKSIISKGIKFIDSLYIEHSTLAYRGMQFDGRFWDSLLAGQALAESLDKEYATVELLKTAKFIALKQNRSKPQSPKNGGVGFGLGFEDLPDTDDTAAALLFWSKFKNTFQKEIFRALGFLLKVQNSDGGFPAFSKGSDGGWFVHLFIDDEREWDAFDKSSNDLTGHVLEAFSAVKYIWENDKSLSRKISKSIKKAVKFLRRQQKEHGQAWRGRWGINYTYGTGATLVGLASIGISNEDPAIEKVYKWIQKVQNYDGGFGESYRSDINFALAGRGLSTPTQTAFVLLGLISIDKADSEEATAAVKYLLDSFEEFSGTWLDNQAIGTGIPGQNYIVYPGYAKTYPLLALAKYLKAIDFKNNL